MDRTHEDGMVAPLADEDDEEDDDEVRKDGVTLSEAQSNCDVLMQIPLEPRDCADIEAASCPLHYDINLDAKFTDRGAFNTGHGRIQQEVEIQARLVEFLELGEDFASLLYTWRNCSRAIPVIKSHDQANRLEIYETTLDVLGPHVEKFKQLMNFQRDAVEQFCMDTKSLCPDRRLAEFVSDGLLLTIGQFLNMLAVLDELKNSKASIKNDFSTYRRALEISRQLTTDERQATQELSLFLGTHNSVRSAVKSKLSQIPGHEDLLCSVINACLSAYEQGNYLTPKEKHSLVKAMSFGIYLVDSENVNVYKLENKRKINIAKIDKILRDLEVVPLYGDMVIPPFSYVKSTPNYDEGKWPNCSSEQASRQMDLIPIIARLKSQHDRLLCDIALCPSLSQNAIFKNYTSSPEQSREVYQIALRSLQKLSSWTSTAVELISWKLAHPTDYLDNPSCPRDAEEYERATKYNFTSEEKFALTDLIAMIKGVQATLKKLEPQITAATHHYVYVQVQSFVQLQLREPLRKAAKKNKELVLRLLLAVRDICGDWARGVDPSQDPILKGKKDSDTGYLVNVAYKSTMPSTTQLYLLRTLLEALIEKTSSKKSTRKELDTQHVQVIENFLKVSYFWPHALNFSRCLYACSDLSQLWFREFYLELAQGQRIQFPIEMSIPWMLTDHILESQDASRMDCVPYLLDLYNDCAWCATKQFRQQYLFDEIEAEVNLCFDQLVYKLSNNVFPYYKNLAASIFLDKRFRNVCRKLGLKIQKPKIAHYDNLLKLRSFQLLGRNINLQKLVSQRINADILKSLDAAITRFEHADITGIMELSGLIELTRLTHRLLSEVLPLADFGCLLKEANYSVNLPCGRITQHLFVEINDDFLPQFCYNNTTNRFVRTKLSFVEKREMDKPPNVSHRYLWGTKGLATSFGAIYGLYSQFIGPPHFTTICQLLQYQDIAVMLKQMLEVIKNTLNNCLVPYVEALNRVIPPRLKQPRYDYGASGVFLYYQAQLTDIMNYSDLQPKMFQRLREVGNAIVFCLMLSQALSQEEVCELKLAAMFQNVIPKPYIAAKDEPKEERDKAARLQLKKLEHKFRFQQIVPVITQLGTEEQAGYAQECLVLTREKLCCGLSIFEFLLGEIRDMLTNPIWQGPPPANGIMAVDDTQEFHRLWSALQFVFCIPPRSTNEYTIEQLFGEGLNWAGCALITLLGQKNRFENMDFCYHLMRVCRVDDQKDEVIKGVNLRKMLDRIRKFQILNLQIFAIFGKYTKTLFPSTPSFMEIAPPTAPPPSSSEGDDGAVEEKEESEEKQEINAEEPSHSEA